MNRDAGWARLAGVIRRRRLPVALTTVAAAALGLLIVKLLPPSYQARTVVRIDDPRPAREYVPPIVSEPDGERLKSTRMGFLARPIVAEAAERAGLVQAGDPPEVRARAVGAIAARLDARLEGQDTVVATYRDGDPARARAFLAALVEVYALRRGEETADRARATAEYLAREVEALRPRVADLEATTERFRLERYGSLPDQLDANLRLLDETQMRMHSLTASLDAALGRRRDILAEAQSPLRRQEEEVARNLSMARTRFVAGAPEVKALRAELARVRSARRAEEADTAARLRESAELRGVEVHIARIQAQVDELRKQERSLHARVEAAAKNGDALARMTLERDVMRDRLRALVKTHEEARLAAGLEASVAGQTRVRVVEPAWATTSPVKPSKPLYALIALALAAALGVGVGLLLDSLDRRVREVEDLRALTGDVPLLGTVPRLPRTAASSSAPAIRGGMGSER